MPMLVSYLFVLFLICIKLYLIVYEKQKREGITEETRAETVEEFEDNEGNVYNKKTYEDLKRQGIL